MLRKSALLPVLGLLLVISAGCATVGPLPTAAVPTKTPKPTFTATSAVPATAEAFPTATAMPATATPAQPAATDTPAATTVPPTETPLPRPRLTANQNVNVRGGPGTNYAIVGRLAGGDSYDVTAKNAAGTWLQFNYDGDPGWVSAELVTVSGDANAISVAQNIPAPPPPPPTAVPVPTAVPQPTSPPAPRYEFNIALVQRCDRQPAGNWFDGTVYKGGQPANGFRIVFSYAPDGPWATQPQISGPHEGYTGWNAGYYSHIIKASDPIAGDWYVWIVNSGGARISEMAHWHSTGPGDGCNQATVDFDSR